MPRVTTPLTDKKIKGLKPQGKIYTEFDGGGLYIEVHPNGGKYWRLKYTFEGKAKKKSLKTYPIVSLADARIARDKAKGAIARGENPFPVKKEEKPTTISSDEWDTIFTQYKKLKVKQRSLPRDKRVANQKRIDTSSNKIFNEFTTFKQWTKWYFYEQYETKRQDAEKKSDVKNGLSDAHLQRTENGWDNDVLPFIGDKVMSDITTADIVKIVKILSDRDAKESAKKVYGSINRLFSLVITHYSDHVMNNPCQIKLSDIIGKTSYTSYPKITDEKELRKLFAAIDMHDKPVNNERGGNVSVMRALQLISYTAVRPANAREAEWSEFTLTGKSPQWVISAEKMKTNEALIIPLAPQVIKMLKGWKKEAVSNRVLPGTTGDKSTISPASMVQALRRMNERYNYSETTIVAHSFRGIFSTIAHESGEFNHDVIEKQLSHTVGSVVSQSYNEAKHMNKRRELMCWWADKIDGIKNG
ncbi:tyrosine-type recombinase/integrase [Sulfurovum sp. CS9]|uniref:tyrosine-type recombinase/integrase n=1 Tax=Sulfurovum sp. CS9 TaxID=3391146 RepID=UPI0039EC2115